MTRTAIRVDAAIRAPRPSRRRLPLRRVDPADGAGHWPLARVFRVGALLAAIVLVAVLATGGIALWRLVETRSAAAQVSTPGVLAGQQLSTALLDQETGLRGFTATGRPDFLEPYATGLERERAAVTRLRELLPLRLRDYAPALEAVERAAQAWRADYAQPALDGAAPPPEVGKARFDEVRAELANLTAELEAQRAVAVTSVDAAARFLVAAGAAIAVLLVAFVVAVGVGLRRAVLRPVSELAGQVRDVMAGSVHREVRASGPREIVELGADIDAMRLHVVRDLDEVQAANRLLDEQARDLERSNRDLEQFAYVASHDLQEPLRKVSSFCQLLQRRYGGKLDERADQYIEFAVDGAQRMQRLINDLLAFSRVGRTTEGFAPVDLNAVAAAAQNQLEAQRADVGGTIEVGELPTVHGDQALLRQLHDQPGGQRAEVPPPGCTAGGSGTGPP